MLLEILSRYWKSYVILGSWIYASIAIVVIIVMGRLDLFEKKSDELFREWPDLFFAIAAISTCMTMLLPKVLVDCLFLYIK